MKVQSIKATKRETIGTRAAQKERTQGHLPSVLYGHQKDVVHLTVEMHEFEAALRQHDRVFDLVVEGQAERALLKSLQYDCFGEHPIHADFTRISAGEKLQIDVEFEFIGHPQGVSQGGRFVHPLTALMVECEPENIPAKIEVLVGSLDIGDGIHVSDLELPEGVTCALDPAILVCSVHAPGGGVDEDEDEDELAEGEGEAVDGESESGEKASKEK